MSSAKPRVAIIMGSDSDLPKMELAETILSDFKIPYEIKIVSAHRTPRFMQTWATKAKSRGIQVIIAGAGGAAHLPGMVASLTPLPVIGVPILVGKLDGLDALLSIAQMPKGVPVATMAVDNSFNAGLLAARILGLQDKRIAKKLIDFEANQRKKVGRANGRLKKRSSQPSASK
ncbi:MAG: 5-(carboxyamino)imidazole ribonucleotide mutase [Bdellovibrionaceae bacterium]|nr:5-(carboxyamino)imidazole ribonucleotide mutase [Bdellovibrionales bacterium]MCB9083115.1 5-(carboxyamino)imidazole ribonucleotide mutase [Pseudobdellovibrionaceae bacterium]